MLTSRVPLVDVAFSRVDDEKVPITPFAITEVDT
jgi:hypothetical protein